MNDKQLTLNSGPFTGSEERFIGNKGQLPTNEEQLTMKDEQIAKDNGQFTIRTMTIEDYEGLYALWMTIKGFGIRSIDDSRVGVERFLKRNPATSVVAVTADGTIVGGILCGHDGRRGCLYHVCVHADYRRMGIGKAMVVYCMNALKAEEINKVSLIAFTKNDMGNAFWNGIGWVRREDLNYYDFTLNEKNITAFNQ